MKRLKMLNRYQKIVLILTAVMVLVFTVLYPLTISRNGFSYHDTILLPSQQGDSTEYTGKIQGQPACFTVSADKTVQFQYGDKNYGPYIAQQDPAAVPQDHEMRAHMTGVALYCGDELLFRGGVMPWDDGLLLFDEDGGLEDIQITVTTNSGVTMDMDGTIIDSMEPSATVILELMRGPQLTHKGNWGAWLGGIAICLVAVVSILFADELFRWNMAFHIRNADQAEPSDWEMAERYISWTVLPLLALALFLMGLR